MRSTIPLLPILLLIGAAGSNAAGGPVPDWVKPGMRLTYYLMTGSVSGSVSGWVPNEDGDWEDQKTKARYSKERTGQSSHGLVQATVAGMDGQVVALSQPFFLFNGNDTTPVWNNNMDTLVTPDTGGDFWMHPQRQALVRQQHPWRVPAPGQTAARTATWRHNGQSWTATEILLVGDASKDFRVYDQATGRLLYLSRLTRTPPEIRDRTQPLRDGVSYATFLRFVAARQLEFPWLDAPMPESAQRLQALTYRGQMAVVFPGAAPGGQPILQSLQVARRGRDWLLFQVKAQMPGPMTIMPAEGKSVTGPGCLPPLFIPPEVLGGLRPGQVIDRDPQSQVTVRVAGADQRTVALQSDGQRLSITFYYDRAQGLLIRRVSRERSTAGKNMETVRDMQLADKR